MTGMFEALQSIKKTMSGFEETRKIISQSMKVYSSIIPPTISDSIVAWQNISGISKVIADSIPQYDYSRIITPAIRDSVIACQNISRISKVIADSIPRYDFSGIIKTSEILANLDFNKLSVTTQMVLQERDWLKDEESLEVLAERISESYVADTKEEQELIDEIKDVTKEPKKELSNEEKALYNGYIQTILTILSIFLTLYFGISSMSNKIDIPESTINNVQYVNNYYIENGYDKDFLNECGLRIVNQEIKPRLKPDCSSQVMGTLQAGRVISVNDKLKKWIHITWTNEDGDYVSGWIQNYKVSEFKK